MHRGPGNVTGGGKGGCGRCRGKEKELGSARLGESCPALEGRGVRGRRYRHRHRPRGLAVTQLPAGPPARLLRPRSPFKPRRSRRAQPSPTEPNRAWGRGRCSPSWRPLPWQVSGARAHPAGRALGKAGNGRGAAAAGAGSDAGSDAGMDAGMRSGERRWVRDPQPGCPLGNGR